MNSRDYVKEYIEIVKKDEELYYKDYLKVLEDVKNSTAIYKGQPVPNLYQTMLFTNEDIEAFKNMGEILISIGNKITGEYLKNPSFRKKFNYPKLLEELILIDPAYDINIPMARLDVFYKDKNNYKFCEFNTDGSSAMNEDNTIARILLESLAIKEMEKRYKLESFELIDKWVEESINLYYKYKGKDKKPNIAIVDFKESGTPSEFEVFRDSYIKKGFNTVIADPRDMIYKDGKLFYNDVPIDLIYRRLVTVELIKRSEEIKDFIQAYKDNAAFFIGSIRSQIMHNKIIFKILHDNDTLELLSKEERNFIKDHIPYTKELIGNKEDYKEVLENKDRFIIKPMDSFASQGVYVGNDISQGEWGKLLEENSNKEYIYQEFIKPYPIPFVYFEDDKLTIKDMGSITGIFLYNEKFSGLYTRVGKENIISGLTNYYTAPTIVVKDYLS